MISKDDLKATLASKASNEQTSWKEKERRMATRRDEAWERRREQDRLEDSIAVPKKGPRERKYGDWDCPVCGRLNFASNRVCFSKECTEPRPISKAKLKRRREKEEAAEREQQLKRDKKDKKKEKKKKKKDKKSSSKKKKKSRRRSTSTTSDSSSSYTRSFSS